MKLSRLEIVILVCIFVFSFVPTFGGLLRVVELAGGAQLIPANPRALADPLPIVGHILSSFIFCIAGALQFLPSLRRQRPAAHRLVGRIVAAAGCVSALTGVWMTHLFAFPEELQGSVLYVTRMVLGLSMLVLIARALRAMQTRNVSRHSAAMLRAYAIGQGASTQTVIGISWVLITGTEPLGLLRDLQMVSAWVLNLLLAEYLIRRYAVPRRRISLKIS